MASCKLQPFAISKAKLRQFAELFAEFNADNAFVVSVTLKTAHNMAEWSSQVAEEREQVFPLFLSYCKQFCNDLRQAGYWADFIDPATGSPDMGPGTSHTMFETDDRMKLAGYDIVDYGCCKTLCHPEFGTFSFGGLLFTNCPMPHLIDMCSGFVPGKTS
eukprot:GFYU01004641.1.p1 GENE.GFYU01004641.1~~GFYU01004641.1.p1  ORF type:complete len:160 (-),score=3.99 GFYU01004641.1:500-979(-)